MQRYFAPALAAMVLLFAASAGATKFASGAATARIYGERKPLGAGTAQTWVSTSANRVAGFGIRSTKPHRAV